MIGGVCMGGFIISATQTKQTIQPGDVIVIMASRYRDKPDEIAD
jgi:hypothetical protein